MNNFTFYSPTFFSFGKDAEQQAGKLVKRFGGSRVLIHYGGGSVVRSGLLDRVKASLEEEDLPYKELGGVKPNPRSGYPEACGRSVLRRRPSGQHKRLRHP